MKKYTILYLLAVTLLLMPGCTNLEEESFSKLSAKDFYVDANSLQAAITRPYEHGHWCGWDGDRWLLQELTADQFTWAQKGKHGYDGGAWVNLHQHSWNADQGQIYGGFLGPYQGIGQCNTVIRDFEALDFAAMGLDNEIKKQYIAELRTLRAWFYIFVLDFFRNVPIVTDTESVVAQSTPQQVFDFIETELKESLPSLLKKEAPKGRWNQAAAASLLVRMYLNAEKWTGTAMYDKCMKLSQEIIDGQYGSYTLDPDYRGPFRSGVNGIFSPENIFEFPHKRNYLELGWMYDAHAHYTFKTALDNDKGGWNGISLSPSLDLNGNPYPYKLGGPYGKFADKDYRKQPFETTASDGSYNGFFMVGQVYGFDKGKRYGYDSTNMLVGGEEWKDFPLILVDQVGRFSEDPNFVQKDGENADVYKARIRKYLDEVRLKGYHVATASKVIDLKSQVISGEESSGVRLLKFPWLSDGEKLFMSNSIAEIRLAEIYTALAECKYRANLKGEAAQLLDDVRKRNYPDDVWNQYSYVANPALLTDDEFVNELGREFIGERRRRTDLVRWNRFGNEWWDKSADTKDRTVFPIPNRALNANPLLKKNGYE